MLLIGTVRIVLRREGAATVLTVEDDGVRPDPAPACPTGLTHTIRQAMAAKVEARFMAEHLGPGTRITMTFSPDPG